MTSIDDRVVARATINPVEPALPGPCANLERQVVEVSAAGPMREIAAAINAVARQNGTRPVVHIPLGTYSIEG